MVHGTTVATNAAIEHTGASTGLITTKGFKDLLELARQKRPDLYNLFVDKPDPLVPRHLRKEVKERLQYDGSILISLEMESVIQAIEDLKKEGVHSIAVCLLHSYVNPVHEQKIKEVIKSKFPEAYISVSHEVISEYREYERLTTTVLNAYLGPKVSQYMSNFKDRIKQLGIKQAPYINQSNGGVMSIEAARNNPVKTALSGPSAGVVGGAYVASLAGFQDIITFDMGGTSTDVCLIQKLTPQVSTEKTVADYPVRIPMIDVNAVGAGGGSIAWIDSGGALKVGPHSAGAEPGPVCYGKGGTEPTVTDANVVLGRLNQETILGGRMKVDLPSARKVLREKIADLINLNIIQAADSILKVVISNMVRAIRVISVERGYDPRDFTLVAFGGAGPLHATYVAKEIGIKKILIPENPGILCALGLLASDIKADYVQTHIMENCCKNLNSIKETFIQLEQEAVQWLSQQEVPPEKQILQRFIDMRYEGQNYELAVSAPASFDDEEALSLLAENFHIEHERAYGYRNEKAPIQLVNFRVSAIGIVSKAEVKKDEMESENAENAQVQERKVFFEKEGLIQTPIYARGLLRAGNKIMGPAVIEQMDSTVVIPPGYYGSIDFYRNIIIQEGGISNESKISYFIGSRYFSDSSYSHACC